MRELVKFLTQFGENQTFSNVFNNLDIIQYSVLIFSAGIMETRSFKHQTCLLIASQALAHIFITNTGVSMLCEPVKFLIQFGIMKRFQMLLIAT